MDQPLPITHSIMSLQHGHGTVHHKNNKTTINKDVTVQTPTATTTNINKIYGPTDTSTLDYTDPFYPTIQPAALPAPKPCFLRCAYHSTCHIAGASCPHEPPPPRQEAKLSIGQAGWKPLHHTVQRVSQIEVCFASQAVGSSPTT